MTDKQEQDTAGALHMDVGKIAFSEMHSEVVNAGFCEIAKRNLDRLADTLKGEDRRVACDGVAAIGHLLRRLSTSVQPNVQCTVLPMKTSSGADYYVHLRNGDRTITPHMFKIEGRAEYEVAEWKWFFGQGEKPDITTFDTEANRILSALTTS